MPTASRALERFQNNPFRQLNRLSNDCERRTMAELATKGFTKLAMHFAAPISLLGQRPQRLTELAQRLGMSKQLCLQSLRPLSEAGYIDRRADPRDKRAKLIVLSKAGHALIAAAQAELGIINCDYAERLGSKEEVAFLSHYAQRLCIEMKVAGFQTSTENIDDQLPFSLVLGMANRGIHRHLMNDTIARGHPQLQMAHGQVLACLDPEGSSIGALAAENAVSSQAISRIARQLDELGYIERSSDPRDGRSQRLSLSDKGIALIQDAVAAMTTLEKRLQTHLGERDFIRFSEAVLTLAPNPAAEQDSAPPLSSDDMLHYLSAQLRTGRGSQAHTQALRRRLGEQGLRQLNQLLGFATGAQQR